MTNKILTEIYDRSKFCVIPIVSFQSKLQSPLTEFSIPSTKFCSGTFRKKIDSSQILVSQNKINFLPAIPKSNASSISTRGKSILKSYNSVKPSLRKSAQDKKTSISRNYQSVGPSQPGSSSKYKNYNRIKSLPYYWKKV